MKHVSRIENIFLKRLSIKDLYSYWVGRSSRVHVFHNYNVLVFYWKMLFLCITWIVQSNGLKIKYWCEMRGPIHGYRVRLMDSTHENIIFKSKLAIETANRNINYQFLHQQWLSLIMKFTFDNRLIQQPIFVYIASSVAIL